MKRKKSIMVVVSMLLVLCLINNVSVFAQGNSTDSVSGNASDTETTKQNIVINIGEPTEGAGTDFITVSGLPETIDAVLTVWKDGDTKPMALISDGSGFKALQGSAVNFESGAKYNFKVSFFYRGQNQTLAKKKLEGVKLVLNGQEYDINVSEDGRGSVENVFSTEVKDTTPVKKNITMSVSAPKEGSGTDFAEVNGLPDNVYAVLAIWKEGDTSNRMMLISEGNGFKQVGEETSQLKFESGETYNFIVSFVYGGGDQDIFKNKMDGVKLNLNGTEYPIQVKENQHASVSEVFRISVEDTTPAKKSIIMNINVPKEGSSTDFAEVTGLPENIDAVLTIWKTDNTSHKMALISDKGGFVDYTTIVPGNGQLSPVKFEEGTNYTYNVRFIYRGSDQSIFKQKMEGVNLKLNGKEYSIVLSENQPATVDGTFDFAVEATTVVISKDTAKADIEKVVAEKIKEIQTSNLTAEEKQAKLDEVKSLKDIILKDIDAATKEEQLKEIVEKGKAKISAITVGESKNKAEANKKLAEAYDQKKEEIKSSSLIKEEKEVKFQTLEKVKIDGQVKINSAVNNQEVKDSLSNALKAINAIEIKGGSSSTVNSDTKVKPEEKSKPKEKVKQEITSNKPTSLPKTGDSSNVVSYTTLAGLSLLALSFVVRKKKELLK